MNKLILISCIFILSCTNNENINIPNTTKEFPTPLFKQGDCVRSKVTEENEFQESRTYIYRIDIVGKYKYLVKELTNKKIINNKCLRYEPYINCFDVSIAVVNEKFELSSCENKN